MRVYRASSLGYSLEALVCPHLGYSPVDPPEFIQKAYAEGHRIEPLAIEKLRGLGWVIQTTQPEINTVGDYQIEVELDVVPGEAKVVGHLDGKGNPQGMSEGVVEIKMMADQAWRAFNNNGWEAPGLVQKYKWQQSAYLLASGYRVHYMIAWNKDTEDLSVQVTSEPFYGISDIAYKLAQAEAHILAGTIPDGCTDFPCPYFYLHADKDAVPVDKADGELDHLLAEWLVADGHVKAYEKQKDMLRKGIIELVGSGDTAAGKIIGSNGVTVSTSWQEAGIVTQNRQAKWVTRITGPRKNGKSE